MGPRCVRGVQRCVQKVRGVFRGLKVCLDGFQGSANPLLVYLRLGGGGLGGFFPMFQKSSPAASLGMLTLRSPP